jgi:hypothetical protein
MVSPGPSLAGHRVSRPQTCAPEHQLVAAIILQAFADAHAGNPEAVFWMDYYAPDIAYAWLGMAPEIVANWREVDPLLSQTSPVYQTALQCSVVFGTGARTRRNG